MKTQVKRRPFGNTGLLVSEVGFGAMNLRMLNTREEGIALVNYVLDQGINLIDTARGYKGVNGSGEEVQSEDMVGTAIEGRTDIDEPIVIVTKGHGYTPEAFDEDLQESLKTLKIKKTDKGLFIGQSTFSMASRKTDGKLWSNPGLLNMPKNVRRKGCLPIWAFPAIMEM